MKKLLRHPSQFRYLPLFATAIIPLTKVNGKKPDKPKNLIVILVDDMGYGDLGFTGNPISKTPTIDSLAKVSTFFNNFSVCPVCAPTPSALLTGRYSLRTGIYDTYNGGTEMDASEFTLAEMFNQKGYVAGHSGKWHLGEHPGRRPTDQGFASSLRHVGGGLAQPSDYIEDVRRPGQQYFDPILLRNEKPEKTQGFCTDVFGTEAVNFVQKNKNNPFFLYLAFNAPHTPLQLRKPYRTKWLNTPIPDSFFVASRNPKLRNQDSIDAQLVFGMMENVDDNLRTLFATLRKLGIDKETEIIFFSDNDPEQHRFNHRKREKKHRCLMAELNRP